MKLLLNENLSFRLVEALKDVYPGSARVQDVGLLGAPDHLIWSYAADHGFILVSKDTDFYERSVVYGAPPKVVWLRVGNSTVAQTAGLRESRYILVRRFVEDSAASFLLLRPD